MGGYIEGLLDVYYAAELRTHGIGVWASLDGLGVVILICLYCYDLGSMTNFTPQGLGFWYFVMI